MIFPEHTYGCGTAALDNSILFPSGTFFGTQNGAFHGSVMNAGSFSLASIFCAPRVGYGWAHGCTRAYYRRIRDAVRRAGERTKAFILESAVASIQPRWLVSFS